MNKRVDAVRALAKRARCAYVLVSDPVDIEYISGFHATKACLLISRRSAVLLSDFRYEAAARDFCKKHRLWRFVQTGEESFTAFGSLLRRGSRVGIQSDCIAVDTFDRLRRKCAFVKFVKLGDAVTQIAMVKQAPEIKAIQRAARTGDKAFAAFIASLKPGMSEKQAVRLLETFCMEYGSEGPSFPTIVLFGSRSALPHGRSSRRRLKKGDWVLCDFGCRVSGFCSDMTRTAVMGRASQKQKRMYDIVYRAQRNARQAIRAGLQSRHIDMRAREVIEKAGYGDAFGHATGHGIGRRIHEKPRVGRHDRTILQENMIVTIEPGIYIERWGGVRIEDMMVVLRRGGRSLTHFPRKLIEIGI
jgi:Xaa-Pro aminopeptidase